MGGLVSACQPAKSTPRLPPRGQALKINLLANTPYAPLLLMRERRLLEARLPDVAIEWKLIPREADVARALREGGLDIAAGSLWSFLRLRAQGEPVQLLAGVSTTNTAIVSQRPTLTHLSSLTPNDRLGIPDTGSHEEAIVRLLALHELGDAGALQNRLERHAPGSLVFPEGNLPDLAAVVVSSPLLEAARVRPNTRVLASVEGLQDPPSNIVLFSTSALRDRQPAVYGVFLEVLDQGVQAARDGPAGWQTLLTDHESAVYANRAIGTVRITFSRRVGGVDALAALIDLSGPPPVLPLDVAAVWLDGLDPGPLAGPASLRRPRSPMN